MALVGNISGSGGVANTIGITGSLIVANPGLLAFPTLPGTDAVFFVSGAIGGKAAGSRTVSVFGGDAVVSGSLTVGTGSITITSNEIQFYGGNAKILSGSGGLTFFDSSYPGGKSLSQLVAGGGGGGTGTNFFTENGASVIYNSGSVAFTGARTGETITAASQKGSDVIFYFSGSKQPIDLAGTNAALFGGNVVTSASFYVKDSGTGALVSYLKNDGTVSGSGNFNVGGNITIAGNIDTDIAESKTLFASAGANTVTIGGSTTTTSIGTGSIGQLAVTGNATITGNLTVNGQTTTVATTNLLVKDPLIVIASGSDGSQGGIAIFSGSSVNTDLVFAKIDVDTWAAGRYDSQNGTNTSPSGMTLTPIRATKFQVNGTNAYVTSSDTTGLELSSTSLIALQRSGNTFLTASSNAGNTVTTISAPSGRQLTVGAPSSTMTISGSAIVANAGSSGAQFQRDGTAFMTVYSGSGVQTAYVSAPAGYSSYFGSAGGTTTVSGSTVNLFADAGVTFQQTAGGTDSYASVYASAQNVIFAAGTVSIGKNLVLGSVASSTTTTVSGSGVYLNAGSTGVAYQLNGSDKLYINNAASTTTISGSASQSVKLAAGTGATTLTLSGSTIQHTSTVATKFNLDSTLVAHVTASNGRQGFFPGTDSTFDLGGPAIRWANIYTGDLHLRNERGNWTIIEEEDYLSITNNISGKRYKFVLEEI